MENKEESQSPKITSLLKLKEKRKYNISQEERLRRKKNWEEKVKPSIINRHKQEKENKEYETTLNDLIKDSSDEEIKIDLNKITLEDVKKKDKKTVKKKFNVSDEENEQEKKIKTNKDVNINQKELKTLLKSLLELQANTKNKVDKLYYAKKNKNNKPKEEPRQPVIINTTKNTYEEDILKAMKSKILNI